jgi:hypothetical protein
VNHRGNNIRDDNQENNLLSHCSPCLLRSLEILRALDSKFLVSLIYIFHQSDVSRHLAPQKPSIAFAAKGIHLAPYVGPAGWLRLLMCSCGLSITYGVGVSMKYDYIRQQFMRPRTSFYASHPSSSKRNLGFTNLKLHRARILTWKMVKKSIDTTKKEVAFGQNWVGANFFFLIASMDWMPWAC